MTDRKEEENIREEIRRSQTAPRRGKRVLTVVLTLVVVLAVVVAAAWKDLSSLDSVRRLFSYNKVQQDEQGKAELYSFSNDRSNVFALLGDHLIVASTTNVSVLGSDGSIVCSENVKLTTPSIAVGGQTAAVYDIGGRSLLVFSASGLVRDMSSDLSGDILSVSLNSSDYMALNAEKSGYKSAVTMYDASGEKVLEFNSSERYVIDATVLRDCKHMAAVTLGESGGIFADTVNIYSLGSDKPTAVNTLTGSLLLSTGSVAGTLACLTDEGLTLFTRAEFERREFCRAAPRPLPLGQHDEARHRRAGRFDPCKPRYDRGSAVHVRRGPLYRGALQRQSCDLHPPARGIRAARRHGIRPLRPDASGRYGGARRLVFRLALYSVISANR